MNLTESKIKATRILIVEDNKIDSRLTRQALQRITDWSTEVEVVDDGEKALQFLRRQGSYENAFGPELLILDLNLPKCDGTEVLQGIRADESLQNLAVFVFSSSPPAAAREQMRRYQVEADAYFEKPNEVGTYGSIVLEMKRRYEIFMQRSGPGAV